MRLLTRPWRTWANERIPALVVRDRSGQTADFRLEIDAPQITAMLRSLVDKDAILCADSSLRIECPLDALHLERVSAIDAPSRIGPVDLVIFAVKLWDTEAAARAMTPH